MKVEFKQDYGKVFKNGDVIFNHQLGKKEFADLHAKGIIVDFSDEFIEEKEVESTEKIIKHKKTKND